VFIISYTNNEKNEELELLLDNQKIKSYDGGGENDPPTFPPIP